MESVLIIIRGNSGSGKSTISRHLQKSLESTFLIPHDLVRRKMLDVRDYAENDSIILIKALAQFGRNRYKYLIVEGILKNEIYKDLLSEMLNAFSRKIIIYMDVTFDETVRRSQNKHDWGEFTVDDLRKWWCNKDYLNVHDEIIFNDTDTEAYIIQCIMNLVK